MPLLLHSWPRAFKFYIYIVSSCWIVCVANLWSETARMSDMQQVNYGNLLPIFRHLIFSLVRNSHNRNIHGFIYQLRKVFWITSQIFAIAEIFVFKFNLVKSTKRYFKNLIKQFFIGFFSGVCCVRAIKWHKPIWRTQMHELRCSHL